MTIKDITTQKDSICKERIIIKGIDSTNKIDKYEYEESGKVRIVYKSGKSYLYHSKNVQIKHSILSNDVAMNCFLYLKDIARIVGSRDSSSKNILQKYYEKIGFINKEDNIFASFLTGKIENNERINNLTTIYPFGFNLSQKKAIDNALKSKISVIEGPPGTGKTQTILNITANAIMNNETVAVVSNNNSATANVLEKLTKHGIGFLVAYLGKDDNKEQFIQSQNPLPDLTSWSLSPEEKSDIASSILSLDYYLKKMLLCRNNLSNFRQKLHAIETEYKHFEKYYTFEQEAKKYLRPLNSDISIKLWLLSEKYARKGKPRFFEIIFNYLFRGVKSKKFYSLSAETMISICQNSYYVETIEELKSEIAILEQELTNFDFDNKMNEYSELSGKLFRNKISEKYQNTDRHKFTIKDLSRKPKEVVQAYPIVMSTTHSICGSLPGIIYDYVIVDEASQVDIVSGALALSCAKNVVIVGDSKQIPNVVSDDVGKKTDYIFSKFTLPEEYRYRNHSLLFSILEIFIDAPRSLLLEHYRCHPQIIEFCNQKFYDNQLNILTNYKSERQPLIVYKTSPGSHAREHMNQRQIDIIKKEILETYNISDESIGIITPYRKQANALKNQFKEIESDTINKFQGREHDVIIFLTVDNRISEFTDDPNRLNVAVSRATKQFILVINGNENIRDNNIGDLLRYIQYNNFEVIQSEVSSIFDYLYKNYNEKRRLLLSKYRKISEYDSENLMYSLICDVLSDQRFKKFDVAEHVSLRMIFLDSKKLNHNEKKYVENPLTHVDFMIFDKCGKVPRLGIEVDGFSFHREGSEQEKRDKLKDSIFKKNSLPLMRFKTNESCEKELLIAKLNDVMK